MSTINRYALVTAAGAVENIVVWDGQTPVDFGPGLTPILATAEAEPGGSWDGVKFTPAPPEAP